MPGMTFEEITTHFGSVEKAKAALGLKSKQTIYNWRDKGVPEGWQARIQIQTRGKLKADKSAIPS